MALASRGLRDMDGRVERVEGQDTRRALAAQARRIRTHAALAAAIVTLLFTLWP